MDVLRAIAVPFVLFAAGAMAAWAVLPPGSGGAVVLGAFAWCVGLVVATNAMGIVAIIALPFTIWRWFRGKPDDAAAVERTDRRFSAVFPAALAAWCALVGLVLGLMPDGWSAAPSAALHAAAAATAGWVLRRVVMTSYGFDIDPGVAATRKR